MDCSTPGFPVHHQLPELAQTHVHWVSDSIQWSQPLSSPSPPAFNLFQHQGLFQWVSSSHQVAKVLEFQLQHESIQWIFRTDFLYYWLIGSPCNPRDSQEPSPAPQYKSINSLVLTFFIVQLSHPYMTTGKTIALTKWTFIGKVMSLFFNMLYRLVITFLPRDLRDQEIPIFKRWEYQTILPASWEICMQVKKQQVELDMEQQTGSK